MSKQKNMFLQKDSTNTKKDTRSSHLSKDSGIERIEMAAPPAIPVDSTIVNRTGSQEKGKTRKDTIDFNRGRRSKSGRVQHAVPPSIPVDSTVTNRKSNKLNKK